MTRFIVGIMIILVGLSALVGISIFSVLFPIVIILIGLRVLTGRNRDADYIHQKKPISNTENYINEVAVFSGINKIVKSDDFKGGRLVVVFGGAEIDLSQATSKEKKIEMEVTSVFGGAKIIIPKNWKVESHGTSILGGFDHKTSDTIEETTLVIKGTAVLGGVEVV